MSKLAIQGNLEKNKEIIELLEILGGNNIYQQDCDEKLYYTINDEYNIISGSLEDLSLLFPIKSYTIEEFFQDFPYKIGDDVCIEEENILRKIVKMKWENDEILYYFDGLEKGYTANNFQPYREEIIYYNVGDLVKTPDNKIRKIKNIVFTFGVTKYELEDEDDILYYQSDLTPITLNVVNFEKINNYLQNNPVDGTENLIKIEDYLNYHNYILPDKILVNSTGLSISDFIDWYDKNIIDYPKTYEECCKVLEISDILDYDLCMVKNIPIVISSSTDTINADGEDSILFTIKQDNFIIDCDIYVNGNKIEGNKFTTTVAGEYSAYAKRGDVTSNEISFYAKEVEEPEEPENPIELFASKTNIIADGIDAVTFTVKQDNIDVTSEVEIFVNGNKIDGNSFTTTTAGNYNVNAKKGELVSNELNIIAEEYIENPEESIIISVSSDNILVNDIITFKVTKNNEDITSEVDIFVNDNLINDNTFSTDIPGDYNAYAKKDDIISNTILFNVKEYENSEFNLKRNIEEDVVNKEENIEENIPIEKHEVICEFYNKNLIKNLHKLIICRDAYLKLSNETSELYCITSTISGEIIRCYTNFNNYLLSFYNSESRDAFYENFKDLIEQCKKLI